ncbi:MAG: chromate transporter [Ruminococcus sp.]|nr:chromate transporter [Ruminococcus sp.]
MKRLPKTYSLFLTFLKIGLFTFGGGYAMIPLIQRETVDHKKWISDKDILDIVAIAESTPGPIAINAATFIGYRVGGFFGAMAATVGVVLPSFAIIAAISYFLAAFQKVVWIQYAFNGIRAGVLALIVRALWSMYKQSPNGIFSYLIMLGAFAVTAFLPVNVVFVILFCAAAGIVQALIIGRRDKR